MKYAYVIRLKNKMSGDHAVYLNRHGDELWDIYVRFPKAEKFDLLCIARTSIIEGLEEVVKVKRMPSGNYKIVEIVKWR